MVQIKVKGIVPKLYKSLATSFYKNDALKVGQDNLESHKHMKKIFIQGINLEIIIRSK